MKTSVLYLALLELASVVNGLPTLFTNTSTQQEENQYTTSLASVIPSRSSGGEGASGEGDTGALGDDCLQVLQGLLQVVERRTKETLPLHEQRAAAALREAVRQIERKLQERDEAFHSLRYPLNERMQKVEARLNRLEKQLIPSPERGQDSAFGGKDFIDQLEKRVRKLEDTDILVMEKVLPNIQVLIELLERNSPEEARIDIPPATTGPSISNSTSTMASFSSAKTFPTVTPSTFPTLPTGPFFFSSISTSPSVSTYTSPESVATSAPRATATGGAAEGAREAAVVGQQGAAADDEETAKQRVDLRIRKARAKWNRARKSPSSSGEELCDLVYEGNLEKIQRVLDSGADVNYIDIQGYSPLIYAIRSVMLKADVVSLLLERGADINGVDTKGATALHYAAQYDRSGRIVALLIDAGADVDSRGVDGEPPLLWAVLNENEGGARALLAAGASKSLRGWGRWWRGRIPMDAAVDEDMRDLVRP